MGIRDKNGARNASIHASEHSLPEKLTQALKALRPGVLSQNSSGGSSFASKSGVVDADDVIYYTSADRFPTNGSPGNSHEKRASKGKILANQRKSKSVFTKHSSPSQNDISQFNQNGPLLKEVKSLDQIRHLYKSVPNVSSFDDCEPQTPVFSHRFRGDTVAEGPLSPKPLSHPTYSRHSSQKMLNTDTYVTATSSSMSSLGTSQSPTDSGYRSTSRHLAANLIDPKPPPLPANPPPLSPSAEFSFASPSSKSSRSDKEVRKEPTSPDPAYVEVQHGELIYESTPVAVHSDDRKHSISIGSPRSIPASPPAAKKVTPEPTDQGADLRAVKLPIDDRDVLNVLQKGRCKQHAHLVTLGVVPRLTTALAVPLLRICTEASRLAKALVKCTVNDIRYATLLSLPESVAEECIKSAVQATTLYALSGTGALRISMSRRSGLNFNAGGFYRWMINCRIASIVNDSTAIYLCAVMECLLERFLHALSEALEKTQSVTEEVFDRLMAPHADVCHFLQCSELRKSVKQRKKLATIVCAQTEAELRSILDHLYRKLHGSLNGFDHNNRRSKNALYFGKQAISSLFYFTHCKGRLCACQQLEIGPSETRLYDWLRFILYFVDHRYGMHVDQQDVLQAARLLLPNVDCPPYTTDLLTLSPSIPGTIMDPKKRRQDVAFSMLMSADVDLVAEALNLLGPQKHKTVNDHGLTALSQAVIGRNEDAVMLLLNNNVDVDQPVPSDAASLSGEFCGWTALSWAIAYQDVFLTNRLLDAGAEVDAVFMQHETPLQLAVMAGDNEIFTRLISCGADAFHSTVNYDSLKCNYRSTGTPCALAVAAAFGRREFINIMLSQSSLANLQKHDLSLTDFLTESSSNVAHDTVDNSPDVPFRKLPKVIQKASQEAMYYAVETSRPEIAMMFRRLGVAWNIYTWTKCLQTAYENHDREAMTFILKDFSSKLTDEISPDIVDDLIPILFDVIRFETRQPDSNPGPVALIIARLNKKFSRDLESGAHSPNGSSDSASVSSASSRPIIDPKYADNAELSDIKFKIGDRIIYAHRIVLVNASEEFKRLLDNPSGTIELEHISYEVFKTLINYMYSSRSQIPDVLLSESMAFHLETMDAALTFKLDHLACECYKLIKSGLSSDNCVRVYRFAQRCEIPSLINDCESFILKNFASLVNNEQLRTMLQRSGQPGSCDLCAALANRLVEAFESFLSRHNEPAL